MTLGLLGVDYRRGLGIVAEGTGSVPAATIVIPTHDRPLLLQRAVASALAQTTTDIEVIVVDDASAEPVRVQARDPRLRVFRNQRSLGVSAARNVGLEHARGRWITFLDDDDELLPDMVQASLEVARRSGLPAPVAVLSGVEDLRTDGVVVRICEPIAVPRGGDLFGHRFQQTYTQQTNSLFAPAAVLRAIGGWDGSLKGLEDDDLLLRLVQVCSIEALPQVTYRLHAHDGPRLHRDPVAMIEGLRTTMARYPEVYARYPQVRAKYLAMMSRLYLEDGQHWRALALAVAALRFDPRRPHALRQVGASLLGRDAYQLARKVKRRIAFALGGLPPTFFD
jgi:glycosyltransferase involved in cell wall biosynthesis